MERKAPVDLHEYVVIMSIFWIVTCMLMAKNGFEPLICAMTFVGGCVTSLLLFGVAAKIGGWEDEV